MYCQNCGKELNDNADVCLNCGKLVRDNAQTTSEPIKPVKDTGSVGWAFLGFFFPLVGLILYLLWKGTAPLNASMAGKGALIGVILEVALTLVTVFIMIMASILVSGAYMGGLYE